MVVCYFVYGPRRAHGCIYSTVLHSSRISYSYGTREYFCVQKETRTFYSQALWRVYQKSLSFSPPEQSTGRGVGVEQTTFGESLQASKRSRTDPTAGPREATHREVTRFFVPAAQ